MGTNVPVVLFTVVLIKEPAHRCAELRITAEPGADSNHDFLQDHVGQQNQQIQGHHGQKREIDPQEQLLQPLAKAGQELAEPGEGYPAAPALQRSGQGLQQAGHPVPQAGGQHHQDHAVDRGEDGLQHLAAAVLFLQVGFGAELQQQEEQCRDTGTAQQSHGISHTAPPFSPLHP